MSIQEKRIRRTITETSMHCDGPKHEGETFMQYDSVTLSHGYGSPFDGDVQHFCSIFCLNCWVAEKAQEGLAASLGRTPAD